MGALLVALQEAPFIPHCILEPIPSLWGHPAGAGARAADGIFLNQLIAALLKGLIALFQFALER